MRAPNKQRYLNAVRRIPQAEVPFQELEFTGPVLDTLLGRAMPPGRCYELPGCDLLQLYWAAGCDMAYVSSIWELGRQNQFDAMGRKHYVDGWMKTPQQWAAVDFPDLDDLRRRLDDVVGALEGSGLGLIFAPNPVPFLVTTAVGYQDYYQAVLCEPEFILDCQRRLEEWCWAELDVALEYPVDVVRIGAVLCTKQGPMMAPEMLEKFEYPYLREVAQRIHAKGRLALLHADGDLRSLLPALVGMGFEVLHPVEPCDGRQDIGALQAQYGDRLALHGNVDVGSVLAGDRPDVVRRETLRLLDQMTPRGGYICGSSHDISEDVSPANFFAMRDTVHAYRVHV